MQFPNVIFQRKILIFLLLLALPVFLTGCTRLDNLRNNLPFFKRTQDQAKGPVKLVYWGLWESEAILKPLIDEYQKSHPNITIEYQRQTPQQYRERLQTRLAEGTGPDIFRYHNTWAKYLTNDLSPLPSQVMDKDTFSKTFYPTTVTDLTVAGEVRGLPMEYEGLALFYNTDIFNAAGVTKPPTTWDELRTTAAALTVKDPQGKIRTAGIALGTSNNVDHFSDILGLMLAQNGVDFDDLSKNPELAQQALDFYTIFAKSNNVWDDTQPASTIAFASGKLAMYFAPSWRVFEIKKANPSLNFKIAPVPQLPGKKVTWATYWVEGVSSKSKFKNEAWDFLKFLTNAESQKKFYASASRERLFGEPYSRVDLAQLILPDPFLGAFIADAPRAISWYLASFTFDNAINDKNIKVLADAVTNVAKGGGSDKAWSQLVKDFDSNLTQFGLKIAR